MHLKRLDNFGDTIVEVLIAITIIGLMLSGGYIVSSKSLVAERQSQERDQALQLLQSQLEVLHTQQYNGFIPVSTPFCIVNYGGFGIDPQYNPTSCGLNANDTQDTGSVQPDFKVSITKLGNPAYYHAVANWVELGSSQTEIVTLNYRIY